MNWPIWPWPRTPNHSACRLQSFHTPCLHPAWPVHVALPGLPCTTSKVCEKWTTLFHFSLKSFVEQWPTFGHPRSLPGKVNLTKAQHLWICFILSPLVVLPTLVPCILPSDIFTSSLSIEIYDRNIETRLKLEGAQRINRYWATPLDSGGVFVILSYPDMRSSLLAPFLFPFRTRTV